MSQLAKMGYMQKSDGVLLQALIIAFTVTSAVG